MRWTLLVAAYVLRWSVGAAFELLLRRRRHATASPVRFVMSTIPLPRKAHPATVAAAAAPSSSNAPPAVSSRKRYDPTDEMKKTRYSPTKVRLRTVHKVASGLDSKYVSARAKGMLLHARDGNIDAVMQMLSSAVDAESMTLREYNMLIKEFCDGGRLEPCIALMDDMRRHGVKPSVITYTTLISRAGAWQKVTEAELYFKMMLADGIEADAQAFNSLISAYAKSGEADKAFRILGDMDHAGVLPTVVTFNTLIESCARTGKVKRAQEILQMMKVRGLHPDERSFSAVVHACCQAGDVESAFQMVRKMDIDGIKPSAITYSSLVHHLGKTGDLDRAFQVLNLMMTAGIHPNVVTMSSLVYACGKHGQLDLAIRIYREMHRSADVASRPNSITCSTLVDACLKAGEVAKAFAVVRDMRSRRIPLTEVTYTSLITELTRLKQLDRLVEGLMGEAELDQLQTSRSLSVAQQTKWDDHLSEISSRDPSSDSSSVGSVSGCSSPVNTHSNSDVFPGSSKTITSGTDRQQRQKVARSTVPINNRTRTATPATSYFDASVSVESALETAVEFMELFRERCDHKAVVSVYEALKARGTTPNARIYKILLSSLYEDSKRRAEAGDDQPDGASADDTDSAKPTVSFGGDHGVDVFDNSSTGRFLVARTVPQLSGLATPRSSSVTARPPTRSLAIGALPDDGGDSKRLRHDELFRLYLVFQEMRVAGVQADAATYNTLINACASVGDLEKALETVETMQTEGIEPDVITYTSLLKACGINGGYGTVVLAEEIFAQMQQRTNHFSNYVEPTELTFQRLMQVHLRAHAHEGGQHAHAVVNTKRIWELLDDMLRRGLKPGVSSYRSCVKAAVFEGDVEKGLALLIVIRNQTRMGFDFKSWQAVANLCASKGRSDEEFTLRREMAERRKVHGNGN